MTPEQIQAAAQEWLAQSGYNQQAAAQNAKPSTEYWSPKNGTTVFRLLPPGPAGCLLLTQGFLTAKYFKYWLGSDALPTASATGDKDQAIIAYAGKKLFPQEFPSDPIADAVEEFSAYFTADQVKKLRPRARCLANLWIKEIYDEGGNRIDPDACNKIVVADLPIGFHDHIKSEQASAINQFCLNPAAGIDIVMTRTGRGVTGTEYKYGFRPGASASPIVDDLDQLKKILSEVGDLHELIKSNCARDKDRLVDGAARVRSWAEAKMKNNPFGSVMGGGAPGAFPGAGPGAFPGVAPGAFPGVTSPLPAPQQATAAPPMPPFPVAPVASAPVPAPIPTQASIPTPPPAPMTPAPVQAAAPAPAPAAPQSGTVAPSRPECYKQFVVKNNTPDPEAAVDATCVGCDYRIPCAFESSMG